MVSAALDRARWAVTNVAEVLRYARESLPGDYRLDRWHAEIYGRPFPALSATRNCARWLAGALLCALMDHRIVMDSDVGPDHGHEHAYCGRCGKTVMDHWYY